VATVEDAVKWLSYTYLYVRMRCNPLVYGVSHVALQVTIMHCCVLTRQFSIKFMMALICCVIFITCLCGGHFSFELFWLNYVFLNRFVCIY